VKGPGFGTGAICKNDELTRPCPSLDLALARRRRRKPDDAACHKTVIEPLQRRNAAAGQTFAYGYGSRGRCCWRMVTPFNEIEPQN